MGVIVEGTGEDVNSVMSLSLAHVGLNRHARRPHPTLPGRAVPCLATGGRMPVAGAWRSFRGCQGRALDAVKGQGSQNGFVLTSSLYRLVLL